MNLKEVSENIYNDIWLIAGLTFFIVYIIIVLALMYPYYKYNGWALKRELEEMLSCMK